MSSFPSFFAVGRSVPNNWPCGTITFHREKAKMAERSISHWHSLQQLPSTESVARKSWGYPTTSNIVSNKFFFFGGGGGGGYMCVYMTGKDRKKEMLCVDCYLTSNYGPRSLKSFLHLAVNPLSWRDHSDKYLSRLRCPQVQLHGPNEQLCQ